MTLDELTRSDDRLLRRYEYDDALVVAVDLGLPDDAISVDFLDDTAIVVVREGGEETQYDVDLPAGESQAFMKNGVLTIEVST